MADRKWENLGLAAIAAVKTALEAEGLTVMKDQITPGRPAWLCDGATIGAWIDTIDDTRGDPNCLDTPKLTWIVSVGICGDDSPEGGIRWLSGMQAAWCALSAWVRDPAVDATWGGIRLGFTRANQRAANETVIDYTLIVEEGCTTDGSEDE